MAKQADFFQHSWLRAAALAALVVVAACAFSPAFDAQFLNFDDDVYVTGNPMVSSGLTWENVVWAFTESHGSNWHPLAWISHMLDVELYGLAPGGHHATAVLLHVVNTVLLVLALNALSGAFWRSLFVGALFALHPLHVESVAWVSERKDVLCCLFFFAALWCYAGYAKYGGVLRYVGVVVLFALALMSKPMAVTLPGVLLLLDFWPLGRVSRQGMKAVLLDKAPLLAMAGVSVWVTVAASHGAGAMASLGDLTLADRGMNALWAYARYVVKTFAPVNLAMYYPFARPQLWQAGVGAAVLLAGTAAGVRLRKQAPYVLTGWLWFVGMLLPVIGVIQVGGQSMADRYTYIPLVGLFVALVWGVADVAKAKGLKPALLGLGGVAACLLLAGMTYTQSGHWKNNITLYEHTLAVTEKNFTIHYNLGKALSDRGRWAEAVEQYEASLAANPGYFRAMNNLAWLMSAADDPAVRNGARAVELAEQALNIVGKNNPMVLDTLAAALAEKGDFSRAEQVATFAAKVADHVGMVEVSREIKMKLPYYAAGRPYRIQRPVISP